MTPRPFLRAALAEVLGRRREPIRATAWVGKPCREITCPPLEDVHLEISPDPPEPGAFARAVAEHYHGTEFAGVFTPDYEDELEASS